MERCKPDLLDMNRYEKHPVLNFVKHFYYWPIDMEVRGFMEGAGSSIPAVRLARCNESDLEDGQSCMD